MCVGDPMGVAKLELTLIISATQNVMGFTPSCVAVENAIGANIAPAAVFEMNSVMNVPVMQIAMSETMGFVPHTLRMPLAISSASPVCSIAYPKQMLPAKTTSTSQSMDCLACLTEQHRNISMRNAAAKQHSRTENLSANTNETAIRESIIRVDMTAFLPASGVISTPYMLLRRPNLRQMWKMTVATVTFGEETVMIKVKNGEETAYSLNGNKPLEAFFAHTFTLTANQDPDHIENYYSTFYTSECAYKLPASVKAYIGTVGKYGGANVLNLTKTDTIHAGEAVILRAQPANTADRQTGITLMPSCNRRLASKDNKLTGTDVAVDALGPDDYALTLGQKGVGFYNWSGRPLGAHKAYLRWSGSKLTSSGSFGFVFDDGTVTGIGSQEIPFVPDATCTYNLSGIPVDDSYDGIVIKDGKKYISNGPM